MDDWDIFNVYKNIQSHLPKQHQQIKTLMNFDGLLYMLGSIPMFVITILLLVLNAISYLFNGMTTPDFIMNIIRYIVPTFSYQFLLL